MQKAILFGAGRNYTRSIRNFVKRYDILAVVDNFVHYTEREQRDVLPPDKIFDYAYDYIIVTVEEAARDIVSQLLEMGVDPGKILLSTNGINFLEINENGNVVFKKAVVFGAGASFKRNRKKLIKQYNIVAVVDNYAKGLRIDDEDIDVLPPEKISCFDYDYIIVTSVYLDIVKQLAGIDVDISKVLLLTDGDDPFEVKKLLPDDSLICSAGGVLCKLKYDSDFDIAKEIFSHREYHYSHPSREQIVIDIGMNTGLASLYFASLENVKKVYGFEPFKRAYYQALFNFDLNADKKIIANNYALSNWSGVKTVYDDTAYPGGNSIFREPLPGMCMDTIEIREAGAIVSDIISRHHSDVIVLKIDTEGSEIEIFESLHKFDLFRKISVILLEYHECLEQICDYLSDNAFFYTVRGQKNIGIIKAINTKRV